MRILLIAFLFSSTIATAQWKSYTISVRGDTINRVDLKGQKQGPWVMHFDELRGEPGFDMQGYFVNDQKDGRWVKFSLMGDKLAEENYRWGSMSGTSKYYTNTGGLIREENWRAVEPGKVYDTLPLYSLQDPTKVIDHRIIKVDGRTMKHGTWTFYDPEWGTVLRTETYFMDKLRTGNDDLAAGDDDLKPLAVSNGKNKSDTTGGKTSKKPQAILDYEKKNAGKKKIKSRDGNTGL